MHEQNETDPLDRLTNTVSDLVNANAKSAANNERLIDAVQKESELRAEKIEAINRIAKQARLLLALVVVGLCMLGVLVVKQQQDSAARSKAATEQRSVQLDIANQLQDCLNPGGVCYEQGQTNTAATVKALFEREVLVQRCGVAANSVPEFDACVAKGGIEVTVKP